MARTKESIRKALAEKLSKSKKSTSTSCRVSIAKHDASQSVATGPSHDTTPARKRPRLISPVDADQETDALGDQELERPPTAGKGKQVAWGDGRPMPGTCDMDGNPSAMDIGDVSAPQHAGPGLSVAEEEVAPVSNR
ncbi:hypothetical protein FRC10_009335 [Ceratobasidium sp. 414]|nr:hypothetical protein FRC10_009335 [Ceratobasidium sp. 414]